MMLLWSKESNEAIYCLVFCFLFFFFFINSKLGCELIICTLFIILVKYDINTKVFCDF
jgi:hypothetical protein